jgi:hypothetical protein
LQQPQVRLVFLCCHAAATEHQVLNQTFKNSYRNTQNAEDVYGNEVISRTNVSELSETFRDGCEDHHNVQGVGGHQLLDEICEQMQKFTNLLPETVE